MGCPAVVLRLDRDMSAGLAGGSKSQTTINSYALEIVTGREWEKGESQEKLERRIETSVEAGIAVKRGANMVKVVSIRLQLEA